MVIVFFLFSVLVITSIWIDQFAVDTLLITSIIINGTRPKETSEEYKSRLKWCLRTGSEEDTPLVHSHDHHQREIPSPLSCSASVLAAKEARKTRSNGNTSRERPSISASHQESHRGVPQLKVEEARFLKVQTLEGQRNYKSPLGTAYSSDFGNNRRWASWLRMVLNGCGISDTNH